MGLEIKLSFYFENFFYFCFIKIFYRKKLQMN